MLIEYSNSTDCGFCIVVTSLHIKLNKHKCSLYNVMRHIVLGQELTLLTKSNGDYLYHRLKCTFIITFIAIDYLIMN